jgi:hypothetical protein
MTAWHPAEIASQRSMDEQTRELLHSLGYL